jgi:hypothetical protein
MSPDPIVAEAERVYARYAREIVEAFDLCPWAERARLAGQVLVEVVAEHEPGEAALLERLAAIALEPRYEIVLLLFPRFERDRVAFERFVAGLREAHARRHPLGKTPFALAAFHYDAPLDASDPERLVPFIRRTPDPTIQVVRLDALERVREKHPQGTAFVDPTGVDLMSLLRREREPSLREKIARNNLDRIRAAGFAAFEARLADIKADRDASYARLARAPSQEG